MLETKINITELIGLKAEFVANGWRLRGQMVPFSIKGGLIQLYFSGTERWENGQWVQGYDSWHPFIFHLKDCCLEIQPGLRKLITPVVTCELATPSLPWEKQN